MPCIVGYSECTGCCEIASSRPLFTWWYGEWIFFGLPSEKYGNSTDVVLCTERLRGASEISVYRRIGRGIIQVSFFARVALRVDFRYENSVAVLTLKFHYSTQVISRDFSTPCSRIQFSFNRGGGLSRTYRD